MARQRICDECGEPARKPKKWYAKQLLPLTYVSTSYGVDGKRQLCVYRMWLGRVFNARYFDLAG